MDRQFSISLQVKIHILATKIALPYRKPRLSYVPTYRAPVVVASGFFAA